MTRTKLFIVGWLLLLLALSGCERREVPAPATPLIPVTFATTRFIGEAPSYIAYEKGFFRDEGLEVTLKKNIIGWQSLKNLFDGEADMATVAELPIVYAALDRSKFAEKGRGDFVIFGDLVYSNQVSQALARKDRGINSPEDLRGKTIAVPRGTTVDFFLDSFLAIHRIQPSEITTVNLDVVSQVEALVKGEVDAIFSWQPHVREAQLKLGDNAYLLPLNLYYHTAWLLTSMQGYAEQNPLVLQKFLRALTRAEQYLHEHPEESMTIYARQSETDLKVVKDIWHDVEFSLGLSEALLTTMEDEARWVLRNGLAPGKEIPNFLELIDLKPMQAVKPEGITIIQ